MTAASSWPRTAVPWRWPGHGCCQRVSGCAHLSAGCRPLSRGVSQARSGAPFASIHTARRMRAGRKLKRALKKASDADAATAFAALLGHWLWPQTVKLKTHCLLHDDDDEGAASAAWRRVETLHDEVKALLARFAP